MALELPLMGPLTYDDLVDTPDDGRRYELVDGTLVVTPSPILRHQRVVSRLHLALAAAAPPGVEVLVGPFDVKVSELTKLQPDILVLGPGDPSLSFTDVPPLLVVEVLSRSTRRHDLLVKRSVYEDFGVPSYWIVDAEVPSLTVLELVDGTYAEVLAATGDEVASAVKPFVVHVVPSALVN